MKDDLEIVIDKYQGMFGTICPYSMGRTNLRTACFLRNLPKHVTQAQLSLLIAQLVTKHECLASGCVSELCFYFP
jgi:hypothetical protein